MKKYIITFGTNQLKELAGKVRPMSVMLVIEGENENEARQIVFDSFIGQYFCTSYPYEAYVDEFKRKYEMVEYSLDDLIKMKDEK